MNEKRVLLNRNVHGKQKAFKYRKVILTAKSGA